MTMGYTDITLVYPIFVYVITLLLIALDPSTKWRGPFAPRGSGRG